MTIRPSRLVFGAVGLLIGGAAVVAMREATLSTHQRVEPGSSIDVVLDARTEGGETAQTLDEMVEALLLACRLEVSSDLAGPIRAEGNRRFRVTLSPSLDKTNRRQFRGCVEDWTIDHLRADIISLRETAGRGIRRQVIQPPEGQDPASHPVENGQLDGPADQLAHRSWG